MSTTEPSQVEQPAVKSAFNRKIVIGALIVGGVTAISVTAWKLFPGSQEEDAVIESDNGGKALSNTEMPNPLQAPALDAPKNFNLNNLDDNLLQSARAGKITVDGDDPQGTKAKAWKSITNGEGVNATILKRLSDAKFDPTVSTAPPDDFTDAEKDVLSKLVQNKLDDLRKVYSTANVPTQKDVTPSDEEKAIQAKEKEAQDAAAAEEAEKAKLAAEEAEKAKLAAEETEKAKLAAEEAEKAKLAAEEAAEAEQKRLEAEAEAKKNDPAEIEKQRIEALKAGPVLDIDLSTLGTADDDAIKKAFDFITAEHFTVKAKTADPAPDDALKAALIQTVKDNQLTLELFKKLIMGTAGAAEETELAVLRAVPPLKDALRVPDREKTPLERFTEFETSLHAYFAKYTDNAAPRADETAAFKAKLTEISALSSSIESAKVTVEIQPFVKMYNTNPALEDLVYAHLKKILDTKILECRNDPVEVQTYVTMLKRDFAAKFNADYDSAANAQAIPDVHLRVLAYGESSAWGAAMATIRGILAQNFKNPLSADAKAAFTTFIGRKDLFKLYFEAADKPALDAGMRAAIQLDQDIKTYTGKVFIEEAKTVEALDALKTRLTKFKADYPAVAAAVGIPEPTKNVVKTDPDHLCKHHYDNFVVAMEAFLNAPNTKLKTDLDAKFTLAHDNCPASVTDATIRAEMTKSVASILKEKFEASLNSAMTSLNVLPAAEITVLDNKLKAAKLYNLAYKVASTDDTAQKNLCTDACTNLKAVLAGMQTAVIADAYVESAKLNWSKCAAYCETGHSMKIHDSLQKHIEANIKTLIQKAEAENVDATRTTLIIQIINVVGSLNKLEPANKYVTVTTANLTKFVNFSRNVIQYITARNNILTTNPITVANKNAFTDGVNAVKIHVPLEDCLVDDLDANKKTAYDELVPIAAADPTQFDNTVNEFWFTKLDGELQAAVTAKNKTNIDIVRQKMSLVCKDKFDNMYRDDLEFETIKKEYEGVNLVLQVSKDRLKAILGRNQLKLQHDMDQSLLRAFRHFVDHRNVLKLYMSEPDGADKSLMTDYLQAVGKYLIKLETPYPIGEFATKLAELENERNNLVVVQPFKTRLGVTPDMLEQPVETDLKRKLTDACATAYDSLKAAFEAYLMDHTKMDTLITAFNNASHNCSADNREKVVIEPTLPEYVNKIFKASLEECEKNPTACNSANLNRLNGIIKNFGCNDIDDKYKSLFKIEYDKDVRNIVKIRTIMDNWALFSDLETVLKKAHQFIGEIEAPNLWNCYYGSTNITNFNVCKSETEAKITESLKIFANAPYNSSAVTLDTINCYAFEKAISDYINVDTFFDGKAKDKISAELVMFKTAIKRITANPFNSTLPKVKAWTDVISRWKTESDRPSGLVAKTWNFMGSVVSALRKMPNPEYYGVEEFFTAVLEKYWETADDEVYSHAESVFNKLTIICPTTFTGTIEAKYFEPLKSKSALTSEDVNRLKAAIKAFTVLAPLKEHLDAWAKATDIDKSPQFYLEFINADNAVLEAFTARLKDKTKELPPLSSTKSISTLHSVLRSIEGRTP